MNLISKILTPQRVELDLDLASREALFQYVGALFERDCGIPAKKIADALAQREKLGSTGLGMGIAIPHQRMKGLKEAQGAFLRLRTPIAFAAPDEQAVGLFFVMLAPEQANEKHLHLLAELAQMFSDKEFRDALKTATESGQALDAFLGWSVNA